MPFFFGRVHQRIDFLNTLTTISFHWRAFAKNGLLGESSKKDLCARKYSAKILKTALDVAVFPVKISVIKRGRDKDMVTNAWRCYYLSASCCGIPESREISLEDARNATVTKNRPLVTQPEEFPWCCRHKKKKKKRRRRRSLVNRLFPNRTKYRNAAAKTRGRVATNERVIQLIAYTLFAMATGKEQECVQKRLERNCERPRYGGKSACGGNPLGPRNRFFKPFQSSHFGQGDRLLDFWVGIVEVGTHHRHIRSWRHPNRRQQSNNYHQRW